MAGYTRPAKLLVSHDTLNSLVAHIEMTSTSVGAHAEELRAYFVQHEGKKKLEVKSSASQRDYAHMAREFASKIHENVRMTMYTGH